MSLHDGHALWLVIGILGVWRVTHLATAEDGPWALVARVRGLVGHGMLGQVLDCFQCLSLWMAMPWALVLAPGTTERVLVWLALSGAAILLERITTPTAAYAEGPPAIAEVHDDVLRQ